MSEFQFDRAQPAPSAVLCSSCKRSIIDNYYTLGDGVFCAVCRERAEQEAEGWSGIRFGRAVMAGIGVAILGSIVYWGVRAMTQAEFGLVSIAIGFCLGRAVLWGSRNRGGLAYQLLAVCLTYLSISGSYVPDIVQELRKEPAAAEQAQGQTAGKAKVVEASAAPDLGEFLLGVGALLGLAFAMPFLMGAQNIIGLLIIAFGLWQAWKITRPRELVFDGPYSVSPRT